MKLALVNGIKTEPRPRLRGICNWCGSEMVAKCGRVKMWHWAHKSKANCDPWWESEGEWHRAWKDQFPIEWQEVIHTDPATGERHIADVKTPSGLVIEFQHSPIAPEEQQSRENFYQNMIWIVDGDRGSLDGNYFSMGLSMDPINLNPLAYGIAWMGTGRLLHNWAEATVDVYLDFGHIITDTLWRLVSFEQSDSVGVVLPIPRDWLIENCINGEPIPAIAVDEKDAWRYRWQMVRIN